MFAEPPEPGTYGPCLIHHRLNVDTNLSFRSWIALLDPRKQSAKFLRHYAVIIVAPRVAGDFSCRWIFLVLLRGVVVKRDDNHGSRSGKDLTWIDAFFDVTRHPRQCAVVAASQPLFQAPPLFVQRSGANNSDPGESRRACALFD